MAESLINSIARLRVIERDLLTKDTVGRLVSAPGYEECLKILSESGYGAAAPAEGDEIEALTEAQLLKTYALVSELLPKRHAPAAEVFRMRHDVLNIKLLYKLRMMQGDLEGAKLDFGGIYDEAKLKAAISKGDYSMLPDELSSALEELDVATYKKPDPKLVSCRIDSAYMRFAQSIRSAFTREYFGALADFTNLLSIARGFGEEYYLPGGEYGKDRLNAISDALKTEPDKAPDLIKGALETGALKEKLREAAAEFIRTSHTSAIERARDEYLIGLASEGHSDIDSPAPIVGYLLAREREAEVIRLLLTAKRSGIPVSALEERSLALYG